MKRKSTAALSRFWIVAAWTVSFSLISLPMVVAQEGTNYTCNPFLDYDQNVEICPKAKISNNVCDNPNHGGDDEKCLGQDCIDCNYNCGAFSADCFGCMNALGCYYCPGDASCQNANVYRSDNKKLSCTNPDDFRKAGEDDPDEVCITPGAVTMDPLYESNSWAYELLNVEEVWTSLKITGKGIRIRVNDDGVDVDNLDLEGDGKFDQENSCPDFAPDPNAKDYETAHGTKVAGIIVGNADNKHCAVGIAYDASFSSCNVLKGGGLKVSDLTYKMDSFDISSNSYGMPGCSPDNGLVISQAESCPFTVTAEFPIYDPCTNCDFSDISLKCENDIWGHCKFNFKDDEEACVDFLDVIIGKKGCDYDLTGSSTMDALAQGVKEGRDGKGIIYVFASNNSFQNGDDTNMSGFTNTRYSIIVGAVGKDGLHADYSTGGASLHVVAPVGDYDDLSHLLTTGLGGGCTNSGVGNSYAAPVVSGIVALMLDARPELTWRDVQAILVLTSRSQNDSYDTTKQTNSAGFTHSNLYGFGIVDALGAVLAAQKWTLLTPEYQAFGESAEENQPIPNDGTEYVSEITLSDDYQGFSSEATTILLNLQHYKRGDLELTLVSPSGMESVLHPGRRPEDNQLSGDERWKLTTLRNWGEDPTGTWKLKIKDLVNDNKGSPNQLRSWKLVMYGRTVDGLPPVLTGEFAPSSTPTFASAPPSILSAVSDAPSFLGQFSGPETKGPTSEPSSEPSSEPTDSEGGQGVETVLPGSPTVEPTEPPTPLPTTAEPTFKHTMPPFTAFVRPTIPLNPRGTFQPPSPAPAANVGNPQPFFSRMLPPVITNNDMDRPTIIARPATTPGARFSSFRSKSSFQRFDADEDEPEEGTTIRYLPTKMVKDLSLVLEGVTEVPKTSWPSLQIALTEHTEWVVATAMPGMLFKSRIQLVSVTSNEVRVPNHERRNLRPDVTSVTIVYNEIVEFDPSYGEENLGATELAVLAFQDSNDREAFVNSIHMQFDGVEPMLESLTSVSTLTLPPSPSELLAPTEIPASMEDLMSDNNNNDRDPNFTIVSLSAIFVGLLCGAVFLVWRRRNC